MKLDELLGMLEGVGKSGDRHTAKCPGHDDNKASLGIKESETKLDVQCYAGCSIELICKALGIKIKDLYHDDKPIKKKIIKTYDYTDEHGKLIHQTVRYEPKDFRQRQPDGKGGWIWNLTGVDYQLYNLLEVIKADTVYIVEGEKDVETFRSLNLVATSSPLGAGKWKPEYNKWLKDKIIRLVPDNDKSGFDHVEMIYNQLKLITNDLRIIQIPDGYKDFTKYFDNTKDTIHDSFFDGISPSDFFNQKPPTPTDPKAITQSLLTLGPIEQAEKIKEISKESGISKSAIKSELSIHKQAEKAQAHKQKTESKLSAAEKVVEFMGENIIIPKNQLSQPQRLNAHMIIKTPKEEYLTPFFNNNNYTAAPGKRTIIKQLEIAGEETGFEVALGGYDENALSPTVQAVKNDIETQLQDGLIGKECEISFGPYLDDKGKFNTIADENNGVMILRGWSADGAEVIRTAPQPKEDYQALKDWCDLFGDNRYDVLAHAISALINEFPEGKHCLGFVGSSGGGKTTAATWLAKTIDIEPSVISASGLEGNFPKFFSCRSPILDNLDNKSLSEENMDTVASAISSETVTVRARYTPSGLTERLGFPIFTSIHSDILNYYRPLRTRAVMLVQNFDEKIAKLAINAPEIIKKVRPVIYWLIEQYLIDEKAGKIPELRHELRLVCFAKVRYWIATRFQEFTDDKALELIRTYVPTDSEDMSTPFTDAFIKTMDIHIKGQNDMFADPVKLYSKDLYNLLLKYATPDLEQIRCGKTNLAENSQAPKWIKKHIEKSRMANKIGSYYVYDKHDDHKKQWYFEISLAD